MKWDFEGDYLKQFSKDYRGTIGDRFCQAVRNGNEDAEAILNAVRTDVAGRSGQVWLDVENSLSTGDAWDFAQHILDRESLPYEEKIRLKNESKADYTSEYVQSKMASEPPTFKQLNYLEGLRCHIVPKTKLEASVLIDELTKNSRELPKPKPKDTPF